MLKKSLSILLIALIIYLISGLRSDMFDTIKAKLLKAGLTPGQANNLTRLLMAQAMHETRDFKSESYRKGHNLFGMKNSTRPYDTTTVLGHAGYANDSASIDDMIAYLKASRDYKLYDWAGMDLRQYVLALKGRGYFEDSFINYYNGMARNYK